MPTRPSASRPRAGLANADLVLWQLGTSDALAQVPVADFFVAVTDTSHMAQGPQESTSSWWACATRAPWRKDLHYQAIRTAIKEIAKE